MSYTIQTLWYNRKQYLPPTCAVAFSALLVALQCGMLLGTFAIVSIPIDHTPRADLWIGCRDVISVDISRPIPRLWRARLRMPEIERSEVYYQGFGFWRKGSGAVELAIVIGSQLGPESLGAVDRLTRVHRHRLAEAGTVVVDRADLKRLGIDGVGAVTEVNGRRIRVVGLVEGLKGLSGPYLFCSLETARDLLGMATSQTTYLLARCRPGLSPIEVRRQLDRYGDMSVFTRTEFSNRSRLHWLFNTGGGLALLAAAVLGLLVGALITTQTLYAAAAASMKEYAVLRAMGISRQRIASTVITQAIVVGLLGIILAGSLVGPLAALIQYQGANVQLPSWMLLSSGVLTFAMAMLSGVLALRSIRLSDPVALLR
jgi:putative ABC transport system permease protein